MQNSFKIGDKVVIVRSPATERIGTIATITNIDYRAFISPWGIWKGFAKPGEVGYVLDLNILPQYGPHNGFDDTPPTYPASCLELYKNDSHEKIEWTEDLIRICKPHRIKEKV